MGVVSFVTPGESLGSLEVVLPAAARPAISKHNQNRLSNLSSDSDLNSPAPHPLFVFTETDDYFTAWDELRATNYHRADPYQDKLASHATRLRAGYLIGTDIELARELIVFAASEDPLNFIPYAPFGGVVLRESGKAGLDAFLQLHKLERPEIDALLIQEIIPLGKDGAHLLQNIGIVSLHRSINLEGHDDAHLELLRNNLENSISAFTQIEPGYVSHIIATSLSSPSRLDQQWGEMIVLKYSELWTRGIRDVLNDIRVSNDAKIRVLTALANSPQITLADNMSAFIHDALISKNSDLVLAGLAAARSHPESWRRVNDRVYRLAFSDSAEQKREAEVIGRSNDGPFWKFRHFIDDIFSIFDIPIRRSRWS